MSFLREEARGRSSGGVVEEAIARRSTIAGRAYDVTASGRASHRTAALMPTPSEERRARSLQRAWLHLECCLCSDSPGASRRSASSSPSRLSRRARAPRRRRCASIGRLCRAVPTRRASSRASSARWPARRRSTRCSPERRSSLPLRPVTRGGSGFEPGRSAEPVSVRSRPTPARSSAARRRCSWRSQRCERRRQRAATKSPSSCRRLSGHPSRSRWRSRGRSSCRDDRVGPNRREETSSRFIMSAGTWSGAGLLPSLAWGPTVAGSYELGPWGVRLSARAALPQDRFQGPLGATFDALGVGADLCRTNALVHNGAFTTRACGGIEARRDPGTRGWWGDRGPRACGSGPVLRTWRLVVTRPRHSARSRRSGGAVTPSAVVRHRDRCGGSTEAPPAACRARRRPARVRFRVLRSRIDPSPEIDSVAFLTNLSIGKRVVGVTNGNQSYSMSGIVVSGASPYRRPSTQDGSPQGSSSLGSAGRRNGRDERAPKRGGGFIGGSV